MKPELLNASTARCYRMHSSSPLCAQLLIYGTFANIRQHKHAHTRFSEISNYSESAFSCVTSRLYYRFKHFNSYTKSRSTHKEVVLLYVENPRTRISFDCITAVWTGIIAQIVSVFYYHFFAPKSFTLGPLGKLHLLFP